MYQISNVLMQAGIPRETLVFLLSLPVIATIATFFRHLIGWKSFGIFLPIITTFAFVELGVVYGLSVSLIVIGISVLIRFAMKKARLHYFSRIALVLTGMSLFTLCLLWIVGELGLNNTVEKPILPVLLIIIVLGEEFISAMLKQGTRTAGLLYVETVVISLFGYFLIIWPVYQKFIINWPIILILTIAVNIWVGKWKGLRLSEFFRFRKVIQAEKERMQSETK